MREIVRSILFSFRIACAFTSSGFPNRSMLKNRGYIPMSSNAPPARYGLYSLCSGSKGKFIPKSASMLIISPIIPLLISSLALSIPGSILVHKASIRNSFFLRAIPVSTSSCCALMVKGFSHKTFFPDSRQSLACA